MRRFRRVTPEQAEVRGSGERRSSWLLVIACAFAIVGGLAPARNFGTELAATSSTSSHKDAQPAEPAGQAATPRKAYLILAEGEVNHRLAGRVRQGLGKAAAAGAEVAIVEIDTLGGRLDAAVEIRDKLLDVHLRTIAFVNKRAISAGALIALAAHDIVMAPGSTIGAATPVRVTWGGPEPAGEKTISYFRKEMKATAESRDHPTALAEAMVDPDVTVPGLVEKGKLLTLTTQEAVRLNLAVAQSEDLEHLLKAYKLELLAESRAEAARAAKGARGWGWLAQFRAWQLWLILGLVLALAEMLIPGFFVLWFGVGAFLASLLAWLGAAQAVQVGVFLAGSFLLLVFSRTIFRSVLFRSRESIPTNIEALKGRSGVAVKAIEGSLKPGLVKIGGEVWSAICEDDTRVAKGAKVEILEIVGNKVRVRLV
ncbi:MAG: nodulation protein NfeD [Nitrospiraceae bacterium]